MLIINFRELINKHGVCVRVLGKIDMLPVDIQRRIAEAMYCSRNNTRCVSMLWWKAGLFLSL